jgi:hypothetical protein
MGWNVPKDVLTKEIPLEAIILIIVLLLCATLIVSIILIVLAQAKIKEDEQTRAQNDEILKYSTYIGDLTSDTIYHPVFDDDEAILIPKEVIPGGIGETLKECEKCEFAIFCFDNSIPSESCPAAEKI